MYHLNLTLFNIYIQINAHLIHTNVLKYGMQIIPQVYHYQLKLLHIHTQAGMCTHFFLLEDL